MQRRVVIPRLSLLAVAAALIAGFTACGSSGATAPGLTAADLVGSYNLVSLTLGNSDPLTPPTATGVLTLTLTNYNVALNLPSGAEADSGTWTVSGNNWTQTSSVQDIQEAGTVSLSHDTLAVNVNVAGTPIANIWVKQQ
ncbi:MAG TPA: hypothetical protein VIC55_01170 [Gemmatimonadaceae bacterium]